MSIAAIGVVTNQVVGNPTRGDSLLDFYVVRPESALISCGTVQGISYHWEVLLDVEWAEKGFVTQEKCLSTRLP